MFGLVEAIDKYTAAVDAQTYAFTAAIKTASQIIVKDTSSVKSTNVVTNPISSPRLQVPATPVATARPARKRVSRSVSAASTPAPESIKEEESDNASEAPPTPTMQQPLVSGRRRVVRRVSAAPGIGESENTNANPVTANLPAAKPAGSFGHVKIN